MIAGSKVFSVGHDAELIVQGDELALRLMEDGVQVRVIPIPVDYAWLMAQWIDCKAAEIHARQHKAYMEAA